jgi:integrase/recombinase XerD
MKWEAKVVKHKGKFRIAIYFDYHPDYIHRIRKIEGATWSKTHKAWLIPDTPENRLRCKLAPAFVLNPSHEQKITQFIQWMESVRLSDKTVKVYSEALRSFFKFYNDIPAEEITNEDLILFNTKFILANKLSSSYQNQIINAIKKYYSIIEHKKLQIELVYRPKREKLLPNVLSKEEVKLILEAHSNLKHRAMLSLIYSCGLRCSELLHLKPLDIQSDRNIIVIKQAKGKKDRITPLSPKVLALIREYYKYYKPKVYLFEGQQPGTMYDDRSLQQVLKQALYKAKINKPVTLHWLRHSYATHLLESGTNLRYIQEILGHKSSRTTEIYTHVSKSGIENIKSPFDSL